MATGSGVVNGRQLPLLRQDLLVRSRAGSGPRLRCPRPGRVGIVHLGIGAFHRAHQAVITEEAAAACGTDCWGISGVSLRSPGVREQLDPQDCLFTVLERGTGSTRAQVIGSVREVMFAQDAPSRVMGRIADPGVSTVTLTVTEKGYCRTPAGDLDFDAPLVRADLACKADGPRSAVGLLTAGLERRMRTGGGPVNVISCDNMTSNGKVLQRLVLDFCSAAAMGTNRRHELVQWILNYVDFPSTMVDRIVPATTEEDRRVVEELLGVRDEGTVVAEPFRQWVIENSCTAPRPPWELAGALMVDDVAPWEALKLRILNATHSTLAYLGALQGYETVAEAVADPRLARIARELMSQDATPTLQIPPGLDLPQYCDQVAERFSNPSLRHKTTQIAMDGSQKLPLRLLGIVTERLACGQLPYRASLGVAAWMTYVARASRGEAGPGGLPMPLQDPLRNRLGPAVAQCSTPREVVDGLLGLREVFSEPLSTHPTWRELLTEQVTALQSGDLP